MEAIPLFRLTLLCTLLVLPLATLAQAPLQAPPPKPAPPKPVPHPILDHIRATNALICGLAKEEDDYSRDEDHGNRAGFDIDLCKAVAVAMLGPSAHLIVKSYPDETTAVRGLRTGEIDLLASASPSVVNTAQGLVFSPTILHDGQGFLILNNATIKTPLDLADKKICFATGSTAEQGLHAYAEAHQIQYTWYPFSEDGEMEAAFFTTNCDAITGDITRLANIRAIDAHRAHDFTLLPQLIRQDPLAAATLGIDPRFAAVVRWTIETLFAAEQLGITQANAKGLAASDKRTEVQQLLGQKYGTGTQLELDPQWGLHVLEAEGNYGELYDRNLGLHSEFRIERGEDRLWTDGGVVVPDLPGVH